jgi:uncharacterized protein with HEPN domain
MSREFLDFIEDILDAMNKAELLLKGVTFSQFEVDFRINFAVVRALEIIGEASNPPGATSPPPPISALHP